MRKKIKLLLLISLVLISTSFIIYFFLNYYHNKQIIKNVSNSFTKDTFQSKSENITKTSDLSINIDGSTIIGVIKIEKINFEGVVYEGTSSDILKKGVGHFESSSITKR